MKALHGMLGHFITHSLPIMVENHHDSPDTHIAGIRIA